MAIKKHSLRSLQHRPRTALVNQRNLEAVVAVIRRNNGVITASRISSRRHRGRLTVMTIITYTGGDLVSQNPATFRPFTPRCTVYGNRHDFRVKPVTVSIPRHR